MCIHPLIAALFSTLCYTNISLSAALYWLIATTDHFFKHLAPLLAAYFFGTLCHVWCTFYLHAKIRSLQLIAVPTATSISLSAV